MAAIDRRPDPDPHRDLIDMLVQATFTTMAVLNAVAADHDLSLTQLRVLGILRDRRVRISELAAHLGLDRSTLSGLVDRAEKRGLVVRTPNADDGRAVDVHLSRAGLRLAKTVRERVGAELAPTTDSLSETERRRLSALLQRTLPV